MKKNRSAAGFLPGHNADGNPEPVSALFKTVSARSEFMDQDQPTTKTDAAEGQSVQDPATAARSALVRKAHVGREEHQARAMTLAKALRLTAAKVADDLFDLALAVIGFRAERHASDALAPLFDDTGLLMLLEGPERSRAAAVMDAALVGALIQQQTMGKVLPTPEGGETRRLTDTDAAICAPFLDALLARVTTLPEVPSEQALIRGYAFGARTEEPRLLLMALEAQSYRVLHLTVDIEGGRRQGTLMFCLPEAAVARAGGGGEGAGDAAGLAPQVAPTPRTLRDPVMALKINLPVALTRIHVPLKRLSALKVGDTVTLEGVDFGEARVLTPQGKTLGKGSLGQLNGVRALRIMSQPAAGGAADGFGASMPAADHETAGAPNMAVDPEDEDRSDLPDLPDMSDLPELEGVDGPDSGDLPDMPELDGMPDLPDMSDLPDFDDLPDLADMEALKAG